MALVAAERWMAFAPWPESLRAEIDRTEGETSAADDRYTHAFALACQVGDPCWEGMSARGSGLLRADAGDVDGALRWLEDGVARATRLPDTYQWVSGYVLDATAGVTVAAGDPSAAAWVDRLSEVGRAQRDARARRTRPRARRTPRPARRGPGRGACRRRHRQPGPRRAGRLRLSSSLTRRLPRRVLRLGSSRRLRPRRRTVSVQPGCPRRTSDPPPRRSGRTGGAGAHGPARPARSHGSLRRHPRRDELGPTRRPLRARRHPRSGRRAARLLGPSARGPAAVGSLTCLAKGVVSRTAPRGPARPTRCRRDPWLQRA